MDIGERIRDRRQSKGLTMEELGKEIGTTAATISRYELGQRNVSLEVLNNIATALEIDLWELIGAVHYVEKLHSGESWDSLMSANDKVIYNENLNSLVENFRKLNHHGQEKAISYVTDLTKVEDYCK